MTKAWKWCFEGPFYEVVSLRGRIISLEWRGLASCERNLMRLTVLGWIPLSVLCSLGRGVLVTAFIFIGLAMALYGLLLLSRLIVVVAIAHSVFDVLKGDHGVRWIDARDTYVQNNLATPHYNRLIEARALCSSLRREENELRQEYYAALWSGILPGLWRNGFFLDAGYACDLAGDFLVQPHVQIHCSMRERHTQLFDVLYDAIPNTERVVV